MGLLFIEAVTYADIPVMAAYLCVVALVFVTINLVVDLLYAVVDPRLHPARRPGGLPGAAPGAVRRGGPAGAGGALLWRLSEKEPFARFDWGGASLQVRWSNDGRWLATADQTASVHVYDIPKDNPLNMEGFESKVRALAFSADGKRLATAGSPVVTVWPCASAKGPDGARPIQVDGSESEVLALDFSPATGQLATGDGEGTLLVVTFEKGQFRRKRARLGTGISALAWHPTKPLLAVGHASGLVTWLSMES
jgi:WD40 repeat protein